MNNQNIIRATKQTILLSATTHIVLLIIKAVQSADYSLLNIFNILDIDLFFPQIAQGVGYFILSLIFISLVWVVFYIHITAAEPQTSEPLL